MNIEKSKKSFFEMMRGYFVQTSGALAIAFAVMAPVLIGGAGLALDLGQSYLVKERLRGALDAAALAGAASDSTESAIQARVDDFMAANYPDGKIGDLLIDSVDVTVVGDDVTVEASARYDTSFMRLLGIDEIDVQESVTIHRALKGLEVVLVLDNTTSMGATNMTHLKTASTNFVDIIFDRVQDPSDVKIGIVPYSTSVRVGFYGLGMVPDDTEFDTNGMGGAYTAYGDGTPFITLPTGVSYTTNINSSSGWYGCIVEHKESNYDDTATHVDGSYGQLWSTAADGLCTSGATCRGHGWDPSNSSNDPDPDDVDDTYQGPWDIYMYGTPQWGPVCTNYAPACISWDAPSCIETQEQCVQWKWNGQCKKTADVCVEYSDPECNDWGGQECTNYENSYYWNKDSRPNRYCPYAYIQPMLSGASAEAALKAHIQTMVHSGYTYTNTGIAWGQRLLSPQAPFTEGVDYDDDDWVKAIIVMTDGEMSAAPTYSGYWATGKTSVDSQGELEDRFEDVCDALKDNGVVIYTVTFEHATANISDATKGKYEDCATSPDHYADVSTGEELTSLFEEIATKLARLHISQ